MLAIRKFEQICEYAYWLDLLVVTIAFITHFVWAENFGIVSIFSMRTSNGIFWTKKQKKMHFLDHFGPKTVILGQKYSI